MKLYDELTLEETVAVSGGNVILNAIHGAGYVVGATWQDISDFFRGIADAL